MQADFCHGLPGKLPTVISAIAQSVCAGICATPRKNEHRGQCMANAVSDDQSFKNLILDYPRDALAFFAPEEAPNPDDQVPIVPAALDRNEPFV